MESQNRRPSDGEIIFACPHAYKAAMESHQPIDINMIAIAPPDGIRIDNLASSDGVPLPSWTYHFAVACDACAPRGSEYTLSELISACPALLRYKASHFKEIRPQ
jgi:hypothetical protein